MSDLVKTTDLPHKWDNHGKRQDYRFSLAEGYTWSTMNGVYQRLDVDTLSVSHRSQQTVSLTFLKKTKKLVMVSHETGSQVMSSRIMSCDTESLESTQYQSSTDFIRMRYVDYDDHGQCIADNSAEETGKTYFPYVNEQDVMKLFKQTIMESPESLPPEMRKRTQKILAYLDANLAMEQDALPGQADMKLELK